MDDRAGRGGRPGRSCRLAKHPARQFRHRFPDACALDDALNGVLPPDEDVKLPDGCFDVRGLAREYLVSLTR